MIGRSAAPAPAAVSRAPRRGLGVLRSSWLRALVAGAVVYALVTAAAVDMQNINLVPAVLLLGASLIPVTFVTYVFERLAVALHALWDATDSTVARVCIGLFSGTLLAPGIRSVRPSA